MNVDWQIKSPSQKSAISGELFKPGNKIYCYIYSDSALPNQLQRIDILEEEFSNFSPPSNLVACWTRREKNNDEKESQKQLLNNAEEFFLSLFENHSDESLEIIETKNLLKQLLALMLERKRILRRLKNDNEKVILYIHVPTKREYIIPKVRIELEAIIKIQEQLTTLIC